MIDCFALIEDEEFDPDDFDGLFNQFDHDRDGFIDKKEFNTFIKRITGVEDPDETQYFGGVTKKMQNKYNEKGNAVEADNDD